MISVEEAEQLIAQHIKLRPQEALHIDALSEEVLCEPLVADRNYPPFHRVSMDGIAIALQAWADGKRSFPITGCQKAGEAQKILSDPQACLEVMTGAPLPTGCDCVIRYEDVTIKNGVASLVADLSLTLMQSVHPMASDYQPGEELVGSNTLLRAPQWSIAASVGKAKVLVSQRPSIALVSTGDELVAVDEQPETYQIRRSNAYTLEASLKSQGFNRCSSHHFKDDETETREGLKNLLEQNDVIILSGGVSMGKFDYVPSCLKALGVKEVFHKVQQKPGKPLWYGVAEDGTQVFGLPGNPVSSLVCLHRYVLPALWRALGITPPALYAVLDEDVSFGAPLSYFLSVAIHSASDGTLRATPVRSNGSGDFASLARTSGFIELPSNQKQFNAGDVFPLTLWTGNL